MTQETPQSPITEAKFVEIYGNYPVQVEGLPEGLPFTPTIKWLLGMEKDFCPAKPEERSDEMKRLGRLAGYVGDTALKPEHRYLLQLLTQDSK